MNECIDHHRWNVARVDSEMQQHTARDLHRANHTPSTPVSSPPSPHPFRPPFSPSPVVHQHLHCLLVVILISSFLPLPPSPPLLHLPAPHGAARDGDRRPRHEALLAADELSDSTGHFAVSTNEGGGRKRMSMFACFCLMIRCLCSWVDWLQGWLPRRVRRVTRQETGSRLARALPVGW